MMSTGTSVPAKIRREDHASTTLPKTVEVDEEKASPNASITDEETPSKKHSSRLQYMFLLRNLLLLLANIIAWYITNGMNGIEMQSFSSHIREFRAGTKGLVSNIALMLLVTGAQLAFGIFIGMTMLWVFSLWKPASLRDRQFKWSMTRQDVILGSLHGIGSLFTNLGFTYGSASLVQILKLLEPFETILLSRLLVPDDSQISLGIVSSMIFVVGAAVSLIRIRPTPPHPHAVIFAILSGITLSSRNVLQRRQHVQADAQHDEDNTKHTSKLERSVEHFTKLSYHSAVVTLSLAIPLNALLLATSPSHAAIIKTVFPTLTWRLLTWHPLYNAFSIIVLGFCSALTHSLLNAGKRVFAILMAVVWFKEDFTIATVLGLLAVGAGGCWYTVETKGNTKDGTTLKWMKLIVSMALLQSLFHMQGMVKRDS